MSFYGILTTRGGYKMEKRIWSIKEEIVCCEIILTLGLVGMREAEEAQHRLLEKGFEERSISSIQAKLRDYYKIHNNGNISHVAPKSIRVYETLTKLKAESEEGLENFISQVHNPQGDVDDIVSFDSFNKPSITKFVCNTVITQTFDDYFMKLRLKYNKDSEIYNPAGHGERTELMSRKKFNKVVNGEARTKENLLMIAILMKLDYTTTQEFLALCGHTLSVAILSDIIITYAIKNQKYDPYALDITLVNYGCEPLFAVKTRN